jgi:hypothetical protein
MVMRIQIKQKKLGFILFYFTFLIDSAEDGSIGLIECTMLMNFDDASDTTLHIPPKYERAVVGLNPKLEACETNVKLKQMLWEISDKSTSHLRPSLLLSSSGRCDKFFFLYF